MTECLKNVFICFPEGKFKVLTMSYDDGRRSDEKLIEIFNKYDIKGTFHLNGGLIENNNHKIQFSEFSKVYNGHEISCHTYSHPTIARCPQTLVAQQILKDRAVLEKASGYAVRGLSYPNRSVTPQIVELLPHCGIEYARTGDSTGNFSMPDDFLLWKPTCHHNSNLLALGERFVKLKKSQYLFMMYVWGHSYEFDNDNNWDLIEAFCKMVGGRDDIWYATNIQIVDYMNAAKNLKFTVDMDKVYNPSVITVWISVNNEIYKINPGETVEI